MFKIFNKRKRYVVAIITKKDIDYVETIATNKKEAIDIVTEVLLKYKKYDKILSENF